MNRLKRILTLGLAKKRAWQLPLIAGLLVLLSYCPVATSAPWQTVTKSKWQGSTAAEVRGLKGDRSVVVAYPKSEVAPLACATPQALPAGVYLVRFTIRPSQVADAIAYNTKLRIHYQRKLITEFGGELFARVHQPETRTIQIVHTGGPLALGLSATTNARAVEQTFTVAMLKAGGVKMGSGNPDALADDDDGDDGLDIPVDLALSPKTSVYFVIDKMEVQTLSQSLQVVSVETDRIRYDPGSQLKGRTIVRKVGRSSGSGTISIYLEHGVAERTKVKSMPIKLASGTKTIRFEIPLPKEEFGYALVVGYVSADGRDRSEAQEYFGIAENFYRVAVFGNIGGHGFTKSTEKRMRASVEKAKKSYANTSEFFAWAEEDMVEMSPPTEYWFSGQTCYHLRKQGLKRLIELAHEKGIAVVTYGKFIMSGYLGWKTAYDYPNDHRGQYFYPVGMWEGVNVATLDRFRNREFQIYESRPHITGNVFDAWWQDFLPINPDRTPRMVKIAADEMVRSIEMFGWDAVRWDGHPRGGGPEGGRAGKFNVVNARRTQTLVRYFKDIVATKYPRFRHGYNYLLIQKTPNYDWAYEDYELDELCRGGGLLMNESIGNATEGPFGAIAANLQVEGDLCRERGGYFLGIAGVGGDRGRRDNLIEAALWAASGARTYGTPLQELRRYYTRYSQYSIDERLRRLTKPEKILNPTAKTTLWWQPFVYETPLANGKRQLVINFLNLPLKEMRTPPGKNKYTMPAGTDPVEFELKLPKGWQATRWRLINPWDLRVTKLPISNNRFQVPAVAIWRVGVIDLKVDARTRDLASQFGPPKTFGVPRPNLKERPKEVVLDAGKEIWDVNKDMSSVMPGRRRQDRETDKLDALPMDQRNVKLLKERAKHTPEEYLKGWWRGGSLPSDLKLKDKPPEFGDLAPQRNKRFDIFHGRGAMDYRLRLPQVFAGLKTFQAHDAPLYGVLRQHPGMRLGRGLAPAHLPQYDLVLFTGIPHCAIGAENSYALVNYVKAGGGVVFTGGEYVFGKGGYMFTVLDRELLPVLCTETVDTRYSQAPLVFEPGKDFAELDVKLDFSPKPSFWVWNQVALRDEPTVKVFLKSGNRPILVGRQLGKGRIVCLLVDHRGKSTEKQTAFFDWTDWPKLMRAILAWAAPNAMKTDPPPKPMAAAAVKKLRDQLQGAEIEDIAGDLENLEDDEDDIGGPTGATSNKLSAEEMTKRIKLLHRLLKTKPSAGVADLLARQLTRVSALPAGVRWQMIDYISSAPPAKLTGAAKSAVKSGEADIRQSSYELLGVANSAELPRQLRRGPSNLEPDPAGRRRALALGIIHYRKPDLAPIGRKRVAAWNAAEKATKMKYTMGKEFSLERPEHPCLNAEDLLQRVAWLAYLSRHDAKTYAAQFAREWLMTATYEQWCQRSASNLWTRNMSPAEKKRARVRGEDWRRLRAIYARARQLSQPGIEALLKKHPQLAADGFRRANFTAEFRAAMNLLGNIRGTDAQLILQALAKGARNADLARFAAARLQDMGLSR